MTGLILLIVIGSTIWVGVDASGRDFSQSGVARSTAGFVLGSLLLWLVVFPLYIAQRSRVPLKGQHQPPAPSAGEARHTTDWLPPAASGTPSLWSEPAPGMTASEFRACPDCAESIRIAARKCRYCGWIASG
jgi:hypothetical protein